MRDRDRLDLSLNYIKFFFNCILTRIRHLISRPVLFLSIASFLLFSTSKIYSQCIVTTTNADFEYPQVSGIANFIHQDRYPANTFGWRTTATDGMLEFWGLGSPFPAPSGTQYVELNANEPSGLYQDFDTSVATYFEFSFWHRGRNGTDKMELRAGPPGGPYLPVIEAETSNASWVRYNGIYNVPSGQDQTRFVFSAVSTSGNNLSTGNFLDNIDFTATIDPPTISPADFDLGSTSEKTICSGASHTFRASGSPTSIYYWYDATGTILLYSGDAFNTGNLTQTTAYKVKQVNAAGCESLFLDITVIIRPLLTADISAVQNSVCSGSGTTILFTGTPEAEITYTVNGISAILHLDNTGNFSLPTGSLTSDTRYIIEKAKNLTTECENVIIGKETLVTIEPWQSASPASGSPIVCLTQPIPEITHTTTGATGIGIPIGLPAGITAAWANNTIRINGTSLISGIFNYSIPLTGGCGNVSAIGRITINDKPEIGMITTPPAICAGNTLTLTVPAINENGSPIISQGWYLDNILFNPTTALTRADNGKTLVYKAANTCGETTSNAVIITVNDKPSIGNIVTPAAICPGNTLVLTAPAVNENGSPIISQGWYLDNIPFNPATALTRADNGKTLVYKATNDCGETSSNAVTITVNDKPEISTIAALAAICAGNALVLTPPVVNENGSVIISQGWYLDNIPFNPATILTRLDSGKILTYKAANSCGETTSNAVAITVNDKPEIGMITTPPAICAGETLVLTAPAINDNGSSIIAQGWYLDNIPFNLTTPLARADNGKTLVYKVTNDCGETSSNSVTITVNDKPSIGNIVTPAAICPGNTLVLTAPAVNENGWSIISQGWYLDNIPFNPTTALTRADNGKTLVYKATNNCGETSSNAVIITVNDKPEISTIAAPAAICAGNALVLTPPAVNENGSVIISQGWFLNNVSFNPTTALTRADNGKTLVYKAANICGETSSNAVIITVNDKPEIGIIITPPAICAGNTLVLTAPAINENGSPTISQGWFLNNLPFNPTTVLTRADNGKALVYKAANTCGETTSNAVIITVNDKPEISIIAAPAAICSGNTLVLTAPAINENGWSIISQGWYLDNIPFNPTTVLTRADNGKTLVYKATNNCGETSSNAVTITVNDKPEISIISAPAAICAGNTLALSAPRINENGSAIISQGWFLNNVSFNPTTALTRADNGKTLIYKAINSCGETSSNAVTITVNDKPEISVIATPAAICPGNALVLTTPIINENGSSIISEGWYLNNISFNPASSLTRADNGKTLVYKAINSCGETTSNAVIIRVNDKPEISPIAAPNAACAGSTLVLRTPRINDNGSTIISQGWYLNNISFNPATILTRADDGKILIYKATNSCGETSSNAVSITVNDKPEISTISTPAIICSGNTLSLTIPTITRNGSTIISQGWYLNNMAFNPATPLTYADDGKTLTYKAISSCGDASSNAVIVSVTRPLIPLLLSDSVLPEICEGDKDGSFSIEIMGGIAPYRVSLNNENAGYEDVIGNKHSFDNLSGGKHIVYVKDDLECTTQLVVILPDAVKMDPRVTVNYSCEGNIAANSISVTISRTVANLNDVDYSLDGGAFQSSNTFRNLLPGSHIVTARHLNGCMQNTAVFTIDKINPLELTLTSTEMNVLTATAAEGAGNYQYSFEDGPYSTDNKLIIYKSGIYSVTVRDRNGCSVTVSKHFDYIDVCLSNFFTPNADGINDEWGPGCTSIYKNLTYTIMDRYGREISNYRYGQKWNGKDKGQELPSGDYWYVLKLNDPKDNREFIGHFTLYR